MGCIRAAARVTAACLAYLAARSQRSPAWAALHGLYLLTKRRLTESLRLPAFLFSMFRSEICLCPNSVALAAYALLDAGA